MTSEDRELIELWHSESARWSDPGWGDAARQYHAARGGRLFVVEIQPERLARVRQLLGDNTLLARVWRELNERGDRPAPQATFDARLTSSARWVLPRSKIQAVAAGLPTC